MVDVGPSLGSADDSSQRRLAPLACSSPSCRRVARPGPKPVTSSVPRRRFGERARDAWKRVFDVAFASVSLVLLAPVLLTLALVILVFDGRPVLFRQTRVGRYGRPFTMLKFRSMVDGAHGDVDELRTHNERGEPLFKLERDPRVTAIGRVLRRTSFDELPQLCNVIGGSMSIVGPRPALYSEREHFSRELRVREQVRPGITGLWQVEARSDPDFDRYHALDIEYLRSRTFLLDVRLILRTPFVIVRDTLRHRPSRARRERRTIARADEESLG
jgi:lipopolysaccharide/colanic/teichoic acid biosynthesis glycosyltransferase